MKAAIINIGDELLIGQVVNTNSAYLSSRLNELGAEIVFHLSIADLHESILEALHTNWNKADLFILTGGLGPTNDDITAAALADFFDSELVFHEDLYDRLVAIFMDRNIPLTEAHRRQYFLPGKAILLRNTLGSAPGLLFERDGKMLVALPGVPYEMKAIFSESFSPVLRERIAEKSLIQRTFCTAGVGESTIADHIANFENSLPAGFSLAYLPGFYSVRIRLNARLSGDNDLAVFRVLLAELRSLLDEWLYGEENDLLETVLGRLLQERGATISTAESCTGGFVASRITSAPGSSTYFMGSVVAYDNSVKQNLLGVPKEILEQFGAVSMETAKAMAEGVRKLMKTDFALSTTGVAGPAGGSEAKPVGTVWVGYATPQGSFAEKFLFGKDRERNIAYSTYAALNGMRKVLKAPENSYF